MESDEIIKKVIFLVHRLLAAGFYKLKIVLSEEYYNELIKMSPKVTSDKDDGVYKMLGLPIVHETKESGIIFVGIADEEGDTLNAEKHDNKFGLEEQKRGG